MTMRFGVMLGVALSMAIPTATSQATSITTPADHYPASVCSSIATVLDAFNRRDNSYGALPLFLVHDDFGKVDLDSREAFLEAVTSSEGRRDNVPMKLNRLYRLDGGKDAKRALYVAHVQRERWRLHRYEENGMLMYDRIDDPHWARETDYWLVTFIGPSIHEMRQGDFYWLGQTGERVDKKCRKPVEPLQLEDG